MCHSLCLHLTSPPHGTHFSSEEIRFGVSMLPLAIDVARDRAVVDVISDIARLIEEGLEHRLGEFRRVLKIRQEQAAKCRQP